MTSALAQLLSSRPPMNRLGQYQLVGQLGKGGFAPVWVAREMVGESEIGEVAIKLFDVGQAYRSSERDQGSEAARQRRDAIVEEARALRRVDHPHVVRFIGTAMSSDQRVVGLVMEYLRGSTLEDELREGEPLSVEKTLDIGRSLASALAAVHQVDLIHRDVKPANVMLVDGVPKLIDFGIAIEGPTEAERAARVGEGGEKIQIDDLPAGSRGTRNTTHLSHIRAATGQAFSELLGTDSAPPLSGDRARDQKRGGNVLDPWVRMATGFGGTVGYTDPASFARAATKASDLYSLGATLYQCLTGRVPAEQAHGDGGLKGAVLSGGATAPHVGEIREEVPAELSDLVMALLEPDPANRPRSAEIVALELERLRLRQAGRQRQLPPEDVGPFRGLQRYEVGDKDVHFGRTAELAASLERLRTSGLLALVGASGTGKSSLARAAVLPAVLEGRLGRWPRQWRLVIATPTTDPMKAIGGALSELVPNASGQSAEGVVAALARHAQEHEEGVLLLVDQMEELVTLAKGPSQTWAAELVGALGATTMPGVRCVVAIRRDLLDRLLDLPALGSTLSRGMQLVSPMSEATWAEVIDHALEAYDYRFESPALRKKLLRQIRGAAEAMPLVQFVLSELWRRRDKQERTITAEALEELGGLAGALDQHAETTRAALIREDPKLGETLYRVVMALTTADGTRELLEAAELDREDEPHRVRRVLAEMERARLIVREADQVVIAHEALLTQWERLRHWVVQARDDRELVVELEHAAGKWLEGNQDPSRLWRKGQLARARFLLEKSRVRISRDAERFVRAGLRVERRGKVVVAATGLVVLMAVLGTGLWVIGEQQRNLVKVNQAKDEAVNARAQAELQREQANEASKRADEARKRAEASESEAEKLKREFEEDLKSLETKIEEAKTAADFARVRKEVLKKKGIVETPRPVANTVVAPDPPSSAVGPPP